MVIIYIFGLFITLNLLISHFYFKKHLNIHSKSKSILSKGRKKGFQLAEAGILAGFVCFHLFVLFEGDFPLIIRAAPVAGFFILLNFNRGLELWLTDRQSKAYYHDWLAAFMMAIFLAAFALEQTI